LAMFLLARQLGMRFGGALFAGVVYAFGTFFTVWLVWPLTNIYPVIPLILLACDALARRPAPAPFVALAVFIAIQFFGGHPETRFHVLVVAALFFAFRAVQAWRRGPRQIAELGRRFAVFGGAVLAGSALAALAPVPSGG